MNLKYFKSVRPHLQKTHTQNQCTESKRHWDCYFIDPFVFPSCGRQYQKMVHYTVRPQRYIWVGNVLPQIVHFLTPQSLMQRSKQLHFRKGLTHCLENLQLPMKQNRSHFPVHIKASDGYDTSELYMPIMRLL